MKNKKIREICIKTNYVFYAPPTSYKAYNDKLKISKQRISYKRIAFSTEKITKSWDYKTTSQEYSANFERLCSHISSINPSNMITSNCGEVCIEIIYTDMTLDVFDYYGSFHENDLDFIAYLIKKLIPNGEAYSGMLDYDELACLDDEILDESISILSKNPRIEWHQASSKSRELTLAYPSYGPWVWKIFNLLVPDYEYNIITDKIEKSNKQIRDFTFEEVKAMLTYINRGERFGDGYIASKIEDGTLLELLKRLKLLYIDYTNHLNQQDFLLDSQSMYDEGMKLAKEGRYEEAIKFLEPVALNGNKDAQNNLGVVYQRLKNYENSYKWYKLCGSDLAKENILRLYDYHRVEFTVEEYLELCQWFIDKNNQIGYLYLSYIYQNNSKGIEDQPRAFNALIEGLVSCEDNTKLRFEIGYLLEKGIGCKVDYVASHKYYKSILDSENVVAKYNYALQCRQGRGCKQDILEAIKYFTIAGEKKYPDAINELIQIYSKGEHEDAKLAKYWKEKKAKL